MNRDSIDLGKTHVPRLFKLYFIPTLFGLLSSCVVTAIDGVFIGHGVGSDGVAAVNIAYAPMMILFGIGLMLGMGCSVVSSIHLSRNAVKAARINVSQATVTATFFIMLFWIAVYSAPESFARMLGASTTLMPLVLDYLLWLSPGLLFSVLSIIGLFIIRLDGSPKLAMWLNIIPCFLNAVLDYVFIFPLGMGLKGAAIATTISMATGGILVMIYLGWFAHTLRLIRLKISRTSIRLFARNIGYQAKIGMPALLGETSMAVIMFMGNQVFMHYLGDNGVGAFGLACYYCPFIFMIGNAIAQSAQPIISFNFGIGQNDRIRATERLAIITAIICGVLVTAMFVFIPDIMVALFLKPDSEAAVIAVHGLPVFASAVMCYIFNLTAIGYFQSIERIGPSITFAIMRGLIFVIPAFLIMPLIAGASGMWLALGISEMLTSACIISFYFISRHRSRVKSAT